MGELLTGAATVSAVKSEAATRSEEGNAGRLRRLEQIHSHSNEPYSHVCGTFFDETIVFNMYVE